MKLPILSIIFYTGSSFPKKPPTQGTKKGSISQFNEYEINKLKEKLSSSAKDIHNSGVRKLIEEFSDSLLQSNNKYKIGKIFLTVVEAAVNSLVNSPNQSVPIMHYNSQSKSNIESQYFRTVVRMGKGYNRKILSFLNGPTYEKFTKEMVYTQSDYLDTDYKKQLYASSGINQRNYTFLDSDSFLSIGDVLDLTNYEKEVYPTLHEMYKVFETIVNNNSTNITDADPITKKLKKVAGENLKKVWQRAEENDINKKMIRHFAGILNQKLVLNIYNRIPVYDAHVIIRLVRFKNVENKEITNLESLIKNLIWEDAFKFDRNWGEKIHSSSIKKRIEPKLDARFSRQLHTTLEVDLAHLESFTNVCEVMKTWYKKMPSGSTWNFELKERFRNGIYLNKIYELIAKDRKENFYHTPVSYFIMIESFGDKRAAGYRIKDKQTFQGIYSPVELGFDFNFSIEHLSRTATQDIILNYEKTSRLKEFDSLEIGLEYYPRRQEKLNVNYDKIIIGDQNPPGAEFRLELNSSLLENQQMAMLDKIQKTLNGQMPGETVDEDSVPFMDMKNIFGKNSEKFEETNDESESNVSP